MGFRETNSVLVCRLTPLVVGAFIPPFGAASASFLGLSANVCVLRVSKGAIVIRREGRNDERRALTEFGRNVGQVKE